MLTTTASIPENLDPRGAERSDGAAIEPSSRQAIAETTEPEVVCGNTAQTPVGDTTLIAPVRGSPRRRSTALDLWSALLAAYLASRPEHVSTSGEPYPETSAGDVRRVTAGFSRQLCLPRYDFAALALTRAAWRDAERRVTAICSALPWHAIYPENERFWLSDALALAQRLAAIDARRNGLSEDESGVLTLAGDRSDPLTTWQDLRAYFLARRPIKSDRGWRYPETTAHDAAQVARILDEDLATTFALARPGSDAARALEGRLTPWRSIEGDVHAFARQRPRVGAYPDNLRFWRAARSLAIWLSVARDVARADARRLALGGWR